MTVLPYDYSRCAASSCDVKEQCARFTSPVRPDGWQAFTDFSKGDQGACSDFISNRPAAEQAE